ncbi:RagB/SusD family nutrient uptake outer membrane protein [Paraflavitalea pollutisoli]|uniref:RagB/SusD family nutrient uptake outer membrane protein n=1 Tax=Paraflavitalea pollutisoli TaxID=3034143 RepID=UPI0023EAE03F|nr:RagB/SusD family nutrient uptake outer membrane protein [Paraflavitalea sp. H1-2-19X]
MRTSKLVYVTTIWLLLTSGLTACNKLLDVSPSDETTIDDMFGDSALAEAAVAGIYNNMNRQGHFEWSGLSYNTARSADEAIWKSFFPDYFAANTLTYTDNDVRTMWSQGYSSLFTINTCIAGLQAATKLSQPQQSRLLGEAMFCRAFTYFNLVNTWGDAIPLITTPDAQANQVAKSVPRQQVYDQMIADLVQAQSLLTVVYAGTDRVRPNLMAVHALLARVYLYQGRFGEAVTLSSTVINSNLYTPLPKPAALFLRTGKETIWQLMPGKDKLMEPVGDALIYLGTPTMLTRELAAAFEPGDLRRKAWVTDQPLLGQSFTTACKYKNLADNNDPVSNEYYIVLRLAEQYLIRAEANSRLGNTALAIADLNIIRERAGLLALSASLDQQQCMLAVEQERRVELCTEWGHRWFDLRRWPGLVNPSRTRADEILGVLKPDWQPASLWYPVPQRELQLNPFLVQNPGYPAR